jgi:pyruvate formate lyase activating enzyme
MQIHGLNKMTLLDYPKHLAALLFLGGCNMRCPFCQNASLVVDPGSQPVISEEELFSYLSKRRNILEGVCISGGEPTLHPDLPQLIERIKVLGYLVKLDTNGTNPDMLKYLVRDHLIDYVAMDIKNSRKNTQKPPVSWTIFSVRWRKVSHI